MPEPNINNIPVIPSVTGMPALDSLIRSGLIIVATAITAIIVTWLNAHGFNDPNLTVVVSAAILAALIAIATAAWGYINANFLKKAVVEQVVTAAIASEIPPAVRAATTPEQEVKITDALNSGQLKGK